MLTKLLSLTNLSVVNFKVIFSTFAVLFILSAFNAPQSMAQTASDTDVYYPELQVTPSASQRLLMEAKSEKKRRSGWFSNQSAIQVSALSTFISGMYLSSNKPDYSGQNLGNTEFTNKNKAAEDAAKMGMLVGAAWLGFTTYMHFKYTPYQSGYRGVHKLTTDTQKNKLIKERLAEEKITGAAEIGKRMTYLSMFTNLFATAYMADNSQDEATIVAGVGALLSFAPLFVRTHWEQVNEKHKIYKKKIYGPIAQTILLKDPGSKAFVPGLGASFTF